MAKFRLQAGAEFDLLTKPELDDALKTWDEMQVARLRAITDIRLPLIMGKAAGGALTLGGDSGQQLVTPESGYIWSIRHLVIEGLTAGASPDTVNIVRNGRIVWQLNGNQFAQTWGRGEMILNAGETLAYQSVGTFSAAGTIIVHGLAWQVPAQLKGRFMA